MPEIVQDLRPAEEVVWEYYGTQIKAMRRTQLWRLADLHKIPYPAGCSKEGLLRLLDHEEVRGRNLLQPPAGMTEEHFWKLINGPRRQINELGGQMVENQTNVDLLRDALEGKSYFEMVEPREQPSEFETVSTEHVEIKQYEAGPESEYASLLKTLSWGELKKEAKGQGINTWKMNRAAIEEALCG